MSSNKLTLEVDLDRLLAGRSRGGRNGQAARAARLAFARELARRRARGHRSRLCTVDDVSRSSSAVS